MNIKIAASKVWEFMKAHKTALITGATIGAGLGAMCDTDKGKKFLETGAKGLNIVINAGEEAKASSNSSSGKPEHLDYLDLQNLREERMHEERMAEIKAKYRIQDDKPEETVKAEGTVK